MALRCRPLTGRERDTGEVEVVGVAEQTVSPTLTLTLTLTLALALALTR